MDIDISQNEISPAAANIKLLNQYIRALTVNIKQDNIQPHVNLIFDSGAVNGILGIGAALYIHNLENTGYIKIDKVSGCSIGSLIALWYIYGCPEEMYSYTDKLFSYYKEHKNFYMYESIVTEVVNHLIEDDEDMSRINNRLYINYYDTQKGKTRVVSHYRNRNHLITCILKSSHVPFITSSEHKYNGRYIDGIVPHFFTDEGTNLFIKLISFTNPFNCLDAKMEQNIYSRLMRGIVGVNDFFVNGNTDICSYVNDKSYVTRLHLLMRKQFVLFIMLLIDWAIVIKKHIPVTIQDTMVYNKILLLSKSCWHSLQNKFV